jgi:small subunit ribosomal protein S4
MSNYTGPKCRICRQEGQKLFLKGEKCFSPKCVFNKKNYRPGLHGSAAKKMTEYARQLREKQKIKRSYVLTETQLSSYYVVASKKKGDVGNDMLCMLEQRVDTVLFRSGLVSSRNTARQLISHGHFALNGKRITVPSIQVRPGDVLSLYAPTKKYEALNFQASASQKIPNWIHVDKKAAKIEVVEKPAIEHVQALNFNIRLVVEFYSR